MLEFTPSDCLKAASEQRFCSLFLTSVITFGPAMSRGSLAKLTQLVSLSVDGLWLAQTA